MSEPRIPSPKKRDGETLKAHAALCDYARMGPKRSLRTLTQTYNDPGTASPPTKHLSTVAKWSERYDWQDRVTEYDAAVQRAADEEAEREMLEGLALPRERVRLLKRLAATLTDEELYEMAVKDNRLLAQLRGLLDDLAKETGGRVARTHTVTEDYDPDDYTPEENRRIAAGESPAAVRSERRD